ncbi:hypothetical protein PM082_000532 [Marasmius tenuissimus]|nr:hypothetical protein PM082_000532 [Marasmius tenuissimus]
MHRSLTETVQRERDCLVLARMKRRCLNLAIAHGISDYNIHDSIAYSLRQGSRLVCSIRSPKLIPSSLVRVCGTASWDFLFPHSSDVALTVGVPAARTTKSMSSVAFCVTLLSRLFVYNAELKFNLRFSSPYHQAASKSP